MKPNSPESHLSDELRRFGQRWSLTPREHEVLNLIALGTTKIRDVAARLHLSPNTVNNHVNSIFAKTKTRSKSELLTRVLLDLSVELTRHRDGATVAITDEKSSSES